MSRRFWLYLIAAGCLGSFGQAAWADYWVQAGTYSRTYYADKAAQSLVSAGFAVGLRSLTAKDHTWIQLLVGPYPTRSEAEQGLGRLKSSGHAGDGFVRRYDSDINIDKRPAPVPASVSEVPLPVSPSPSPSGQAAPAQPASPIPANTVQPQEQQQENAAPAEEQAPAETAGQPVMSGDDDDLLGLDEEQGVSASRPTGFFQSELAYAISSPQHLSKFRNMLELGSKGHLTADTTWKVSGRIAYDAVFDLNDYYPTAVRDDQQLERSLRETYVDMSAGDWDFRLGRQQIIWGEMVGLFFADVVSAKDMREFVLPDFDILRIPQWAVRSEYFKGDFHGEAIWIPYPTYDEIGRPGADFYPYPTPPPPGYAMTIAGERRPAGSLADSNYGLRLSDLINGWDLSAFFYSSMDSAPTFFREVVSTPVPMFVYTPEHKRIQQIGGTLSKGYVDTVLKVEMVYTHDRWFGVDRLSDTDGVVRKDSLDYAVGLDYNFLDNSRLNVQLFQRWFPDHDPAMSADKIESGASILISRDYMDGSVKPQLLLISSLNREDWMARPKVTWTFNGDWRWVVGADVFGGARYGLFGRYDADDRIYTELRYIF